MTKIIQYKVEGQTSGGNRHVPHNILIAEDDKNIANLIKEIVIRKQDNALIAQDGEVAFKIFSNIKVDLIITDLKMPNIDGMTFIKMVRETNSDVPILIITGYGSKENRERAMHYGVREILSKPCPLIEISNAIDRALEPG
jgi:DNA-binding response OmpR family regulator